MFGKFLCQSLFSSTGLVSAPLAHLRTLYGKDMSQKNEVLFDKQHISGDGDKHQFSTHPGNPSLIALFLYFW
jgi:hypothetical protein